MFAIFGYLSGPVRQCSISIGVRESTPSSRAEPSVTGPFLALKRNVLTWAGPTQCELRGCQMIARPRALRTNDLLRPDTRGRFPRASQGRYLLIGPVLRS